MNTPIRSERMVESVVVRLTTDDKAQLKHFAQKHQRTTSQVVRDLLIEHHIISPFGRGEVEF